MHINVTIPKNEQKKFPIFRNVAILMSIKWTNDEFKGTFESDNLVF